MIFKLVSSVKSSCCLIQLITFGFIQGLRCQIHLLLSKRSLPSQLNIVINACSPVVNTPQRALSFLIKQPMKATPPQKLPVIIVPRSSRIWLLLLLLITILLMKNYLMGYKHVILLQMVELNKFMHGIIQTRNIVEITANHPTISNTSTILLQSLQPINLIKTSASHGTTPGPTPIFKPKVHGASSEPSFLSTTEVASSWPTLWMLTPTLPWRSTKTIRPIIPQADTLIIPLWRQVLQRTTVELERFHLWDQAILTFTWLKLTFMMLKRPQVLTRFLSISKEQHFQNLDSLSSTMVID